MHLDASGCIWKLSDNFETNWLKYQFFALLVRFVMSYAKTDVTGSFLVIFCSRLIFSELGATLGAHLGIRYSAGMASASAIGRFLEATMAFIWGSSGCV